MRFLFIVQGEGKGHMMQSVALRGILEGEGHEIVKVLFGRNLRRKTSTRSLYLRTKAPAPALFISPFFISSKNRKGINLVLTFLVNIFFIPVYIFEVLRLAYIIRKFKPDAVINFYDIIGGIACFFSGPKIRKYVLSHHFFFEHPEFNWPENRKFEKYLLLLHSRITSFSADKKLALSFKPVADHPEKKLFLIPPLLRKEILNAQPEKLGYIHIYTLHPGYEPEIHEWCVDHPDIQVKMFSDFRDTHSKHHLNLELYPLDLEKFIESLIKCSRVVCTAGFETPAEAVYLGKSLQVVPSGNHFEQYCNALDLERTGLGSMTKNFAPLTENPIENIQEYSFFKNWVEKAEKIVLSHLTS